MRMRVQLEVELDVCEDNLKAHGISKSDRELAGLCEVSVASEWFDSPEHGVYIEDLIEVTHVEVRGCHRIVYQKTP